MPHPRIPTLYLVHLQRLKDYLRICIHHFFYNLRKSKIFSKFIDFCNQWLKNLNIDCDKVFLMQTLIFQPHKVFLMQTLIFYSAETTEELMNFIDFHDQWLKNLTMDCDQVFLMQFLIVGEPGIAG